MDKYAYCRSQKTIYCKCSERLEDATVREKIGAFLIKYITIETFYKKLLVFKRESNIERKLTDEELKTLTVQAKEVCEVLDFYGIIYDKSLVQRVFGYQDNSFKTCSIKKLRNRLVHNVSKVGIEAVIERYDDLNADMDAFMNHFM